MPCPDSTRARFVIVFSEFQKRQVLFDSIRANVEDYELITSSIGALVSGSSRGRWSTRARAVLESDLTR